MPGGISANRSFLCRPSSRDPNAEALLPDVLEAAVERGQGPVPATSGSLDVSGGFDSVTVSGAPRRNLGLRNLTECHEISRERGLQDAFRVPMAPSTEGPDP